MSLAPVYQSRSIGFTLLLGFCILAAACMDQPKVNSNSREDSNSGRRSDSTPAASPSAAAEPPVAEPNIQFTLPLLEAILSDDSFVSSSRREVQLTDEELQKLRDISRNAVLKLNDESPDINRSTKGAVAEARKKVQEVLGNDRANRFIALVQKLAQAGDDLPASKPNLIPDDTRIIVNIPAYRMDVFQQGNLLKSYKIGIGYPEFPLPTGLRKASTIIFNPTWTPPDEPWVKGKVEPGKKIEAGSALNPLGPVKIPIGLPSLIHGGKSPTQLGGFASHGCVGLTNPQVQDLALQISKLSGQSLTLQDIRSYEKSKTETKEVKLDEPIPVELRYETIVVENGVLKIYRDVYERGTNTEENLRRVLENYSLSLDDIPEDMRAKIIASLDKMSLTPSGENPDTSERDDKTKNNSNSDNAKITRTIKGQKEMDFRLPQLAGKGYPVPVGMKNAG